MGCLIVFALPFAAAGLFVAGLAGKDAWSAARMSRWEEVPAQILEAELVTSRGSDSTTYKVKARYSYRYNGRDYKGSRVSLHGGSDNIGSFHQRTYRELKRHKDSGLPFRCFVDPGNPYESVLFRKLRWGLLLLKTVFGLVFSGVGLGLMALGIVARKKTKDEDAQKAAHPDKPWLWRKDWAEGMVTSSNRGTMIFACAFAAFWNLIAWPVTILVLRDVLAGEEERKALFVLLFPAAGAGLATWAVRSIVRWRKFGQSRFQMPEVPGVLGGRLAGVVHAPVHITPEDGFHLTLSCVNKVTSGSGKNRSTKERILWQEKRVMKRELLERDKTRSAIPVLFAVPYDQQPTNDEDSDNEILWRLTVSAKVPGVDYESRFEVPVFKTEASTPDFVLDESSVADYQDKPDPERLLRHANLRILPAHGGGVRILFPPARHVAHAIGVTIFFAVWTGFIVLMLKFDAPILFPIIFGLVDLLVFCGVLDMWLAYADIQVQPGRLVLKSGLLGIARTRTLDADQVREIKAVQGMQSGHTVFYGIKVFDANGKKHTAGRRMADKAAAEALAARIRDTLQGTG